MLLPTLEYDLLEVSFYKEQRCFELSEGVLEDMSVQALYLAEALSLFERQQPVRAVEGDALHAHGLLILLTVQLQRLQMNVADFHGAPILVVRRPHCLTKEALARAFERAVRHGLRLLAFGSADRTLARLLPAPEQAAAAEAVGARQHQRVVVDALTDRTGQVLLERRLFRHVLVHVFSHHDFSVYFRFTQHLNKHDTEMRDFKIK